MLIEQAKAMLIGRKRLDTQAAFDRLRRVAHSSSRRWGDVAQEVTDATRCRWPTGPARARPTGASYPMGPFRSRQLTTARVRRRPDNLTNEFGDLLSRNGIPWVLSG
jgi:hypothetical protein